MPPILVLLSSAILLGAVIWLLRENPEAARRRKERSSRVLRLAGDDTREVTIERGGLQIVCVRKEGAWFLQRPVQARAAEGAVERILSVLELLPRNEVITVADRQSRDLRLADYGLQPPRARFALRDNAGRKELLVGGDAPLGNLVYVKPAFSDDIVATSRDVLDVTTNTVEDLRDRSVIHGEPSAVERLEIRRPGGGLIQLAQSGGQWTIQQPVSAWADSGRVAGMLERLFGLRIEKFVWDPALGPEAATDASGGEGAASGVRAESFGLVPDMAAVRIMIWTGRDPMGEEVLLGKPVDEKGETVYAKLRDNGSVYAVNKAIVDVFSCGVNDLRDRDVLRIDPGAVKYVAVQRGDAKLVLERPDASGWIITQPVQWKADAQTVEEIVKRLARLRAQSFLNGEATNLAEYGLAPPAWSVQALAERPPENALGGAPEGEGALAAEKAGTKERSRLLIGSAREDQPTVFAKLDDGDTVFEIATDALLDLGASSSAPLTLRDRTMLSLEPDSVRKITLLKNGAEQTAALTDSGAWTAVSPQAAAADAEAIDDILLSLAHLRALRIECQNPKSLAVYGLDQPGVVLTLGLRGEQGIQKSLMMGFRARTDGLYATVQGQDIVFVVGSESADRLTRDLVKPVSAEGGPRTGAGGGAADTR